MCTHKTDRPGAMGCLISAIVVSLFTLEIVNGMPQTEKNQLRAKVLEMFEFAYGNYMEHAYPADELMPMSCKGRYRGTERSRGDIDDILGNFSLTLVDTLDTLVVLGLDAQFEQAAQLVINEVNFDNDIVVSVFETNIRMLGGLLGGHVVAVNQKKKGRGMAWYQNELLEKAKDLGYRLLPAFNTTTGIPYPRINLRYGIKEKLARTGHERDTCTACAGTMILEFAALSRLTGITIFEEKARLAMDQLWKQRHRSSDLVGTVINIHNGDWVRRESGVGAGIDSYYEYLLKAYILLGDDSYLERFNRHYDAIMKYVSQGPMMVDVHMHRPLTNSRNFMDALLAFWPGLQVLKGDIKPAIEIHEMLYQVTQRHNFLPEAFTTDFRVHWGQHPLRPEFVESTYFLYKATSDPYYLEVGKTVLNNLDRHARVQCGFAAIKDVTSGVHQDQMDSYVLAETFKYLYLLFADAENLTLDIDSYIFTTEAHLLPLSLSVYSAHFPHNVSKPDIPSVVIDLEEDDRYEKSCPNTHHMFPDGVHFAHNIRMPLKDLVSSVCPSPKPRRKPRLQAVNFVAGNREQHDHLRRMGIKIITMEDGRVQLLHTATDAATPEDAEEGMLFMQDMIELSKNQQAEVTYDPRIVQIMDPPYFGNEVLNAGPAQFGYDLRINEGVQGKMMPAVPLKGCEAVKNPTEIRNKIALLERGDCMFIDKARIIQAAGAIGGIVIDHNLDSSSADSPLFSMSGDGVDDVSIPLLFLFREEGNKLLKALEENPDIEVYLSFQAKPPSPVKQNSKVHRPKSPVLRRDQMAGVPTKNVRQGMPVQHHASPKDPKLGIPLGNRKPDVLPNKIRPAPSKVHKPKKVNHETKKVHGPAAAAPLRKPPRVAQTGQRPAGQPQQRKKGPEYPELGDQVMREILAKRDASKRADAEGSESADPTNQLLDHYMQKLDLGQLKLNLNSDFPLIPGSESLLKIIEGPDNSKQITLQMEDLLTGDTDKMIEKITEELFKLLYSQTNFKSLKEQNEYLKAVSDILQAALRQDENEIKSSAGEAFDKLGINIRPSCKATEGKGAEQKEIDIEVTEEGHAISNGEMIFVYSKDDGSMAQFASAAAGAEAGVPDSFTLVKKLDEEQKESAPGARLDYSRNMHNFFAQQDLMEDNTRNDDQMKIEICEDDDGTVTITETQGNTVVVTTQTKLTEDNMDELQEDDVEEYEIAGEMYKVRTQVVRTETVGSDNGKTVLRFQLGGTNDMPPSLDNRAGDQDKRTVISGVPSLHEPGSETTSDSSAEAADMRLPCEDPDEMSVVEPGVDILNPEDTEVSDGSPVDTDGNLQEPDPSIPGHHSNIPPPMGDSLLKEPEVPDGHELSESLSPPDGDDSLQEPDTLVPGDHPPVVHEPGTMDLEQPDVHEAHLLEIDASSIKQKIEDEESSGKMEL